MVFGKDIVRLIVFFILLHFISCREINQSLVTDSGKPKRVLKEYFDKKYLLYKLPGNYYDTLSVNNSFSDTSTGSLSAFKPLGYDPAFNLQYTHIYSSECLYHTSNTMWKYAEVCFPNTCLTKDKAYSSVMVHNPSSTVKTFYVRLFYQNTTYWYPTNDKINASTEDYLTNYYGASNVVAVTVAANSDSTIRIPYTIGMNPKHEYEEDYKDPARPGNYEFMLLAFNDTSDRLMRESLDLKKVNPFAVVKKNLRDYNDHFSYVGSHHFKFVPLDEYFDGTNDLADDHIYIAKDHDEKRLCDTCTGWYRAVINEYWKSSDFFKGFLAKYNVFVKGNYGNRKENYHVDTTGIVLTVPRSTRGCYNKTWGEFIFGPSFKYGHLTVRAKVAQMMNKTGTPNGIIHNLWLFQRDPDPLDTTNPYSYLHNDSGKQPYEIDFEIWNSEEGVNTMWDDNAFINYSVVDYMHNPEVSIKPGEMKKYGKYTANRLNKRQCNIPGENIPRQWFDSFHVFELYWYPDHIRFSVDGYEHAVITKDLASIPDKYAFLWIGSPLYQDGTYYSQSLIPFLEHDKQTIVDYIKIE